MDLKRRGAGIAMRDRKTTGGTAGTVRALLALAVLVALPPPPGAHAQVAARDVQAWLDVAEQVYRETGAIQRLDPCAWVQNDTLTVRLSPQRLTLRIPAGVHIVGPGSRHCTVVLGPDYLVEDWPLFQRPHRGDRYYLEWASSSRAEALIEGVTLRLPLLARAATLGRLGAAGKAQALQDGDTGANYRLVSQSVMRGVLLDQEKGPQASRDQRHTLRDVRLYGWNAVLQVKSQPGHLVVEDSEVRGVRHVLVSPSPKGAAVRHITFLRSTLAGWHDLARQGYTKRALRAFNGHTWYGGDDLEVVATGSTFDRPPGHDTGARHNAWTWRNKGSRAGSRAVRVWIESSRLRGQVATTAAGTTWITRSTLDSVHVAVRGDLVLDQSTADGLELVTYDDLTRPRTLRVANSTVQGLRLVLEGHALAVVEGSTVTGMAASLSAWKQSAPPTLRLEQSTVWAAGHLAVLYDGASLYADAASVLHAAQTPNRKEGGRPYALLWTRSNGKGMVRLGGARLELGSSHLVRVQGPPPDVVR